MSINIGMDKGDAVHIIQRNTTQQKKNNVVMPSAATWMDLEIILSKLSQKEKYQ